MIAKRRNRLMWLTGAAIAAVSGLVTIVLVIVQGLRAEYAEGLRADAMGTAGGVSTDGGLTSNTGLLIGAALLAAPLLAVLIAHLIGPPRGRDPANPAGPV